MNVRWVGGALLAAAAAGPLFTLPLFLFGGAYLHDWAALEALPLVLLFASMFGMVLTVIPSVVAAASLAFMGRTRPWARHPLAWAFGGLFVGLGVGTVLTGVGSVGWSLDQLLRGGWAFGLVGAICALLARWRTRWPEGLSYTGRASYRLHP